MHAVAVGPNGSIFALDRSGGRINVFRTTTDPAKVEFVEAFPGFGLPLDLIVNDDSLWVTDLRAAAVRQDGFPGESSLHMAGAERAAGRLPRGPHVFGGLGRNLYGGDNQYGRTQKFVPKPGADPKEPIRAPWRAK